MKRQRLTASLLKPKLLKKLSRRLVRTFSNLRVSINFTKKFLNSFNNQKTESKRTLNTRKKTQMALTTMTSSMRKTSKFSKRRIRQNKNSKFPSLSASESCSKLIKSTAENWSKSCKPQFCQQLPLMDPSISKSSCFSFWMIWLNFWVQISLDLFSHKFALKSWDMPTQNSQLLDKLLCTESV